MGAVGLRHRHALLRFSSTANLSKFHPCLILLIATRASQSGDRSRRFGGLATALPPQGDDANDKGQTKVSDSTAS
jgi:hypothetical protein